MRGLGPNIVEQDVVLSFKTLDPMSGGGVEWGRWKSGVSEKTGRIRHPT